MKRTLTQKLKHVPTGAPDNADAPLKLSVEKHSVETPVPTEVNRKARTSAAMIGLAISMGASSLLLPQKGDEAMAVEPIAPDPNVTNLPVEKSTRVSSSPVVEPKVVATSKPSVTVKPQAAVDSKPTPAPVIEHQVQQGETLWEVSKTYEIQPQAIAASNRVQPDATLSVGEKLKIPAENGIVHQVQAGETAETISESYRVETTQLQVSTSVSESSQLPAGEDVAVSGNVDELLKVRQEVALDRLKDQQNRLNESLAELRSEENNQLAESVTVPNSTVGFQSEENVPSSTKPRVISVPTPEVAVSPAVEREINSPQPKVTLPNAPVVIPVPTPEVAVSPAVEKEINSPQLELTIPKEPAATPVPTPEVAVSPAVEREATFPKPEVTLPNEPVVIPVPTPEVAVSPTVEREVASPKPGVRVLNEPVVIPVPTPEVAISPTVEREVASPKPGVRVLNEPLVIPVPTPEVAVSPTVEREATETTPEVAVSPTVEREATETTPEVAVSPTVEREVTENTNLVIKPRTIAKTATEPLAPQPVVMETLDRENTATVYQVKPGDTIEEIARNYNLTSSELIEVNELDNPHVIQIDQKLKIPQIQPADVPSEAVTLLPGIRANLNSETTREQQSNIGTPVIPNVPQTLASPVLAQSISVDNESANSTNKTETEQSEADESQYPPHLQRLMAEIEKMRAEYKTQRADAQVTGQTIQVPVAESLNNRSEPSRVNPEFNPNAYNESIQINQPEQQFNAIPIAVPPPELQKQPRRQQRRVTVQPQPRIPVQQQQASVSIPVPPPERGSANSQQGLLATAPVPGQIYNGSLQPQPGEMVAPQLPPLSPPGTYLPDSPDRFNGYIWPSKGVITSGYGMRWGRMHKGLDIAAPIGTPIVAAAPGVVVTAGWNSGGYGKLVEIQHPDGSQTLYAHNNRILVRRGQRVAQGQQISEMGSTGYSTGPHLHFEVHPSGRGAVNPMAYLPRR
ncbi:MAG: peptidoglycan DD-metalloendopeptidase family protein [Symploca sp. SIO3E6]|nr:peptidoglycan DD-metalloendopeptidase family protein [Caldora sp. SIO3E6]